MTIDDFSNFENPRAAFDCFQSHRSRGFSAATAMVVVMVLHGSETYGADSVTSLRDWVLHNTRGTDVLS